MMVKFSQYFAVSIYFTIYETLYIFRELPSVVTCFIKHVILPIVQLHFLQSCLYTLLTILLPVHDFSSSHWINHCYHCLSFSPYSKFIEDIVRIF